MPLFELSITATPVNISALLGVADGASILARAFNAGQFAVYRAVSEDAPTDLNGAVWTYNPGESWTMKVFAGAVDGNTWLTAASTPVRIILEDNAP